MEYDLRDYHVWILRKEWKDVLYRRPFTREEVTRFREACIRADIDPDFMARRMDVYDLTPVEDRINKESEQDRWSRTIGYLGDRVRFNYSPAAMDFSTTILSQPTRVDWSNEYVSNY